MKYTVLLLSFTYSCNPFNYYPDSVLEEKIEQRIQDETGIFIDLSGDSPENRVETGFSKSF